MAQLSKKWGRFSRQLCLMAAGSGARNSRKIGCAPAYHLARRCRRTAWEKQSVKPRQKSASSAGLRQHQQARQSGRKWWLNRGVSYQAPGIALQRRVAHFDIGTTRRPSTVMAYRASSGIVAREADPTAAIGWRINLGPCIAGETAQA